MKNYRVELICSDMIGINMKELLSIIKKLGLSKDEILQEAECVEEYQEWIHMDLIGYSAEELRQVGELISEKMEETE